MPAVLGIVFGFTYRIDGLQDDTPVPLRYRWTTPGVTPPGKPTRVQEEFHWGYTRGSKGGHILRFEEEWELVPGLWKLDVIHKERVLASKSFTVFSPEMDKSNKPSHHAVESLTGETFNGR